MSEKLSTDSASFFPEHQQKKKSGKSAGKPVNPGNANTRPKPARNGKGSRANGNLNRGNAKAGAPADLEWDIQDELAHGNFKLNGKKTKISINHLLDFQLPEVERAKPGFANAPDRRRRRRQSDNHDRVYLHGDSFVNANYKFLVDDEGSYEAQCNDPNVPMETESIRRVVIPKGQSCPICLTEDLTSPRMVICGHVFCQTCLLQLFKTDPMVGKNDESTYSRMKRKDLRECPLCSSIIKKTNVKPVLFTDADSRENTPTIGSAAELQLMCRPHGSLLPLPVNLNIDPLSVGNFPSVYMKELDVYSRIMKCDKRYAIHLLEQDNLQIYGQLEIDKALYQDNGSLAQMALDENIASINQLKDKCGETAVDLSSLTINSLGVENYTDETAFFYYETGFNSTTKFFLSPLDIKVLKNVFAAYHEFPSMLKIKVEDIHYGSMVTETTISKFKYFSHLPIGTELAFIDLDWRNEEIIPRKVYNQFSVELKQRHRKAMAKRNKEDKDKLIYQERLEQEHLEFYQRENNETYAPIQKPATKFPSKKALLNTDMSNSPLPASLDEQMNSKQSKMKERTVWGTQITVTDEKAIEEDLEFEKMLLEASQSKKNRSKKKGKTLPLSSNSTRTL
ncbi:unnamed protein product [Kluyveromyces dobzhanskii CBS 2104]|uniref:WGS project CCBQ000000000 data, contig 00098 n=1 Tax=Kluyveromyces dobzhanskii CBS 2104 TaxID=1427455 RepID=A0A0A8L367_9SACH|nr:unnamed protein product [Kluyveromyces dobzhanskii CBS 2104]